MDLIIKDDKGNSVLPLDTFPIVLAKENWKKLDDLLDDVKFEVEVPQKGMPIDSYHKFKWGENGKILFNFGMYKGCEIHTDLSYCLWIMQNDFPDEVKEVVRKALKWNTISAPGII